MKITINGQEHFFGAGMYINDLIQNLELDPRKVAIEHNLAIVPCSEYASTAIMEGDNIEIVNFIGGG
ncbi:MAG: thiamine biosynthesis protein ThiS [Rickettsiaceae bacterium]|nr:thiamine biosynthesis protein ThiS [Rickettsiaceae bacterium]